MRGRALLVVSEKKIQLLTPSLVLFMLVDPGALTDWDDLVQVSLALRRKLRAEVPLLR